jgi:hypothetical protein
VHQIVHERQDLVQMINATSADRISNPLDAHSLLALIRAIRGERSLSRSSMVGLDLNQTRL